MNLDFYNLIALDFCTTLSIPGNKTVWVVISSRSKVLLDSAFGSTLDVCVINFPFLLSFSTLFIVYFMETFVWKEKKRKKKKKTEPGELHFILTNIFSKIDWTTHSDSLRRKWDGKPWVGCRGSLGFHLLKGMGGLIRSGCIQFVTSVMCLLHQSQETFKVVQSQLVTFFFLFFFFSKLEKLWKSK